MLYMHETDKEIRVVIYMSKNPQSPETCLEKWLSHIRSDTFSYEVTTLRNYESAAKIVLRDMQDLELDPLPYRWGKDHVNAIIECWNERDLRIITQKGYHFVLCKMASDFGNFVPESIQIKWPDEEVLIKWLNIDQIRTVMSTYMSEIQALGIELMARMGRRRIECMRAKVSDMHYDAPEPYMVVDGKGHRIHNMPFAQTTDKILGKWLDKRSDLIREFAKPRHLDELGDSLFIWGRGNQLSAFSQKKCTGWDGAITNDVSIRSGIPFSNHVLRRTFGRELYFTAGVDIRLIQSYYNHATREQTERYIGADERRKSDAIKRIPF